MKRIVVVLLLTTALSVFTFSSSVYAMCGMCGVKEEAAGTEGGTEAKVVNKICPVAGEEVAEDTSYKTVYKGQTVGFCCPECIDKFKADPEKYMAALKKTGAQAESAGATSSESHAGHSH